MRPRIGLPPSRLRKAKLDNLALLPGSALAQIDRYQEIANELPNGGMLLVLPTGNSKQKETLLAVAKLLAARGHQIRVVSTQEIRRLSYRDYNAES